MINNYYGLCCCAIFDLIVLQFQERFNLNSGWKESKRIWTERERGNNGLFITLVPKFYNNVLFISWPNNFGDFSEFWLVDLLGWVFNRFNHWSYATEGIILCIINWGCILIYWLLSYPFRSLRVKGYEEKMNEGKLNRNKKRGGRRSDTF